MLNLFETYSNYYYLILILQGICVFHSIRRGNQSKWIWLIVFLPLFGSIAYIFTEIIKKQHVSKIQKDVVTIVNPGGKLKELEKTFQFSDTFTNRVALADAYLAINQFDKAISLYEPALQGVFNDNEHVVKQLITAYYQVGRFEDINRIAPRIRKSVNFSKSHSNLLFAKALDKAGQLQLAEDEYRAMNHRYANYEARYEYGEFLLRHKRPEDAAFQFKDIIDEGEHMNRREKANEKIWLEKARMEWEKLMNG